MRAFIVLSALATLVSCGLIHHDSSDGHKATSYQNIHMEHYHAVPTYVKKEDAHLLEHPLSKGSTSAKVEVHHGGKHDHGYAVADVHTDVKGHDGGEGYEGQHEISLGGGHEVQEQQYYQIAGHEGAEQGYENAGEGEAHQHQQPQYEHYQASEGQGLGHYHTA